MKFDVVVGNPPYQEDSGTSARDNALYNYFYDLAEKMGEKYVLISPARFLFNAGSTPKKWNQKMLNDPHLKVLFYEQNSSKIFPDVGIAGGIVILYRDKNKNFGAIKSFTSFDELNNIAQLVQARNEKTLNTVISGRGIYRLTPKVHQDFPQIKSIQSKGHHNDIGTGAFDKFDGLLFFDNKPEDNYDYALIQGRYKNKRTQKFIRSDYVNEPFAFDKWRVILPKAYGGGITDGGHSSQLIGEPFTIPPYVGITETYISIGEFTSELEANNALKYIKTKFARAMLAILKITQDNTREKWAKVPMQDFGIDSEIDWSGTVSEIDNQLYKKYTFNNSQIAFIEKNVKEMD